MKPLSRVPHLLMHASPLAKTAAAFPVVAVSVVLSYLYLDRALARGVAHLGLRHALKGQPVSFPLLVVLSVGTILLALGFALRSKALPRWVDVALQAAIALIVSVVLTEYGLKFLFARTLPTEYLLHHHTYGFHWLHGGDRYGSFPSGHTDQAGAIASVLWLCYPRLRWLYAFVVLALSVLLIAGEWHFLSDVIAGGYVGVLGGLGTMRAWSLWKQRRASRRACGSVHVAS